MVMKLERVSYASVHCHCVYVIQTGSFRERYKSPSYQIKEGECVNVDVTGPGATMALGLMFFNTNNRYEVVLCSILTLPFSGLIVHLVCCVHLCPHDRLEQSNL